MVAKGKTKPLVSVITPSFNQGRFLEETIRSVLAQTYQPIQYILIDGGSEDGSLGILRRYAGDFDYWVSEADRGQSEAINKGLRQSRGEVVAWLNADDCYLPWTVERAVRALEEHPEAGMVHGHHYFVDEQGEILKDTLDDRERAEFDLGRLLNERDFINQPTAFIRREALEAVGWLNRELNYAMDYDLWIRLGKAYPVAFVDGIQARYRLHEGAKTTRMPFGLARERYEVSRRHGGDGVSSGQGILKIRWRDLARTTALDGPGEMLRDFRSADFRGLPEDLRRRGRGALKLGVLDGAYICMEKNHPLTALRWLAAGLAVSPGEVLTRGTLANFVHSTNRAIRCRLGSSKGNRTA